MVAPPMHLGCGAGSADSTQADPSAAVGQQDPPVPVQVPQQEPAMPGMDMPDMGSTGDAVVAEQTSDVATNPDAGATAAEQPSDAAADPAADQAAAEQPTNAAADPAADPAAAEQTSNVTVNPDAAVTPPEQPSDVTTDPAADPAAAQQPPLDVGATPDAAQTVPGGEEGTAAAATKPPGSGLNHGALAEELIAERQHQAMGDTPPAAPTTATMVPYTVTEGARMAACFTILAAASYKRCMIGSQSALVKSQSLVHGMIPIYPHEH